MTVLFARVFVLLAQVLSALGVVSGLVAKNSQEHIPYEIESGVVATSLNVANPTYGLSALHDQIVALAGLVSALAVDVSAIPTGPQLAGHAVTLPATAPTGYGPDNTGAANAVWSFILPGGADAGSALSDVYGSAETQVGLSGVRLAGFPWIVATSLDNWNDITEESLYPPVRLDSGTILPTDASILAWANRIGGAPVAWAMHAYYSTTLPSQIDQNSAKVRWFIDMTPAEFAAFKVIAPKTHVLPVWPGLGKATFLTPHALADQLTITAPMDGIAIAIDSAPTRLSFFQFDDLRSYRNLGAISFFTDNGDQEPAQTMGFDEAIYTPKTMVRAGGVKIRVTGGVVGNIYPWTINP